MRHATRNLHHVWKWLCLPLLNNDRWRTFPSHGWVYDRPSSLPRLNQKHLISVLPLHWHNPRWLFPLYALSRMLWECSATKETRERVRTKLFNVYWDFERHIEKKRDYNVAVESGKKRLEKVWIDWWGSWTICHLQLFLSFGVVSCSLVTVCALEFKAAPFLVCQKTHSWLSCWWGSCNFLHH